MRIHAAAADVLAHLVNYEDIQYLKRQPGRQILRSLQQPGFRLATHFRGGQSMNFSRLAELVFDDSDASDDIARIDQFPGNLRHDAAQAVRAESVDRTR